MGEDVFLRNFWECFQNFQDESKPDSPGMPAYFRFLTLLGTGSTWLLRGQEAAALVYVCVHIHTYQHHSHQPLWMLSHKNCANSSPASALA